MYGRPLKKGSSRDTSSEVEPKSVQDNPKEEKKDLVEDLKTTIKSDFVEDIKFDGGHVQVIFSDKVKSLFKEDNIFRNLRGTNHTLCITSLEYYISRGGVGMYPVGGFLIGTNLSKNDFLEKLIRDPNHNLFRYFTKQLDYYYDYVRIDDNQIWLADIKKEKSFILRQDQRSLSKKDNFEKLVKESIVDVVGGIELQIERISHIFISCLKDLNAVIEADRLAKQKEESFKKNAYKVSDCLVDLEDMSQSHDMIPNMDNNTIVFVYHVNDITKRNQEIYVTDELLNIFKILNTAKKNIQYLNPSCEIYVRFDQNRVSVIIDKALVNFIEGGVII
jgi:hypothetical protein